MESGKHYKVERDKRTPRRKFTRHNEVCLFIVLLLKLALKHSTTICISSKVGLIVMRVK